MINCQIVLGSEKKRTADTFTDQTTHFACVPNLTQAYLTFNLDESSEVKVVVDDIDIHKEVLDPGRYVRSLAEIFSSARIEPTGEAGIWTPRPTKFVRPGLEVPKQQAPSVFKVVFRHAGTPHVVATFEFKLLDSDSFRHQLERHEVSHTPPRPPRLADCAGSQDISTCCWHCQGYIARERTVCSNCGMSRNHPRSARNSTSNF